MRVRKFLLFFFFISACCMPLFAQVKFSTVISNRQVGKGDFLQVQYLVENAGSIQSFTPPVFNGFTVVSGPMQESNITVQNGSMSKVEGISYTLKPTAAGKFTVPGATAVVNGKQLHSNSVLVTVTNAPLRATSPSPTNPLFNLGLPEEAPEVDEEYILRKGDKAVDKIKNNLLVKLDVSKTTCYVGEPVVATYKLYSCLKSESRVTRRPSLSQFSVYDMVQPEANSPTIEKLNGKLYNVHIIRKVQLYPLQDGSFDLDPVELDNTVQFLRLEGGSGKTATEPSLDDYINGISNGRMEEQQVTLASKPVTITVRPLPAAGKPDFFDGAVGKFTISASLPRTDIPANETGVLEVTVKGQGNLTLINAPQVHWPAGVEGNESTVKENLDKTIAPITGTKVFSYSFVCKQKGTITIPPVAFAYFDPAQNAYKTIYTDSFAVNISKGARKRGWFHAAGNDVQKNEAVFNWQQWWWLVPLAAAVLLGLFLFSRRKKSTLKKTTTVPAAEKTVAAAPVDHFEGARLALAAVNSQLFYKETGRATWQLLAEKFNLTTSQLNKPVVIRLLQQHHAPKETIQLLENVLNDCELALYTPVHTENDMRLTLEKAEALQQQLTMV